MTIYSMETLLSTHGVRHPTAWFCACSRKCVTKGLLALQAATLSCLWPLTPKCVESGVQCGLTDKGLDLNIICR